MTSGWVWVGLALLGIQYWAQAAPECRVPPDTCSVDGEARAMDEVEGFYDDGNFPREEFDRDLESNKQMAEMQNAYKKNYDTRLSTSASFLTPHWHWAPVCPHVHYRIWWWGFWHPRHGICYVITPITATRCSTRYCRFIQHWTDLLFYHYRCHTHYCRVYFWAWCPWSHTFFLHYRYIPCSCQCHRYFCAGQVWPGVADAAEPGK